jgi:acyl dehydratase
MTDVSVEFDEATQYELRDEDIDRARTLIGVDNASRHKEHLTTVTPDAIRNFAYGVGDDNPLYADDDYGRRTRWGSQIAPNIMAGVVNSPLRGDGLPEALKKSTKSLFRGIHVFVSGGTWDWYRPLRPGDRLYSFGGEESLEVKESEFGGRSVIQVARTVKFNQFGEVVGVYRILRVLTERKTARERGKYSDIEPATYTEDELAAIEERYAQERRRGADPRYFEDVQVGEQLPPMTKGPFTVTDVIAFHAGGYGFVPYGLPPNRLAHINRKRISAFYIKDEYGVPDVAQRLHWSSEWARAIGNPMAYDYGVMRECHFHHHLTDWAGDGGFVVRQHDEIRKFNYMGDTQFLSGEVVDKRNEDGSYLVDVAMKMTNQRGVETTFGQATISLPGREGGSAILPAVPPDLQRKVDEMYGRHHELLAQHQQSANR